MYIFAKYVLVQQKFNQHILNLTLLHANNNGADQPVHLRSLISTKLCYSLLAEYDI